MFKLVAVGGKLRGKEFILEEGENTFGRSSESKHQIEINGVSKNHMSITVSGDGCYLEDMGSSNGTFVNGKLAKAQTISSGDKIAIPNVIFQLVYVKEKKVIIQKKVLREDEEESDSFVLDEGPPKDTVGKIKYTFRKRVMPVIYGFNEQYEWNVMFAILLSIFIVFSIFSTISPILYSSKVILESEIIARGAQYADEVARFNRAALSRGNLDRLNTSFLEDAEGVMAYELFDLEGRIVRPLSKLNASTQDEFSVYALNKIKSGSDASLRRAIKRTLDKGRIGIAKAILAYNANSGSEEPVGIIALKFKPKSLAKEATKSQESYIEALISNFLFAIIFFAIIYYMTTNPLLVLRAQAEEFMRGKRKEIDMPVLFAELKPIQNLLNTTIQKVKELQSEDGGEFAESEDDTSYVAMLNEFMQGAQGPVLILDSEKLIRHMNGEAEDLTGLRENTAEGESLLDTAKDQGFAATVIELCDNSASNEGTNQSEIYELTGKNYIIHVSSLIGKDGFAKAFYITFVLDE